MASLGVVQGLGRDNAYRGRAMNEEGGIARTYERAGGDGGIGRCPVGRGEGEGEGETERKKAGKYRPFLHRDSSRPDICAWFPPLSLLTPLSTISSSSFSSFSCSSCSSCRCSERPRRLAGREREILHVYRSTPRGFHATFPRSTARGLKDPWKVAFFHGSS